MTLDDVDVIGAVQARAFFDDPLQALEFQERPRSLLQRAEIVEVLPDGRRTIDLHMRDGRTTWVQTLVQDVREPPSRQVGHSYTWTKARDQVVSRMSSERRFVAEAGGTRVDSIVEFHVERQPRRSLALLVNWVWGNRAFQIEQEHALHFIAEHLEARHRGVSA